MTSQRRLDGDDRVSDHRCQHFAITVPAERQADLWSRLQAGRAACSDSMLDVVIHTELEDGCPIVTGAVYFERPSLEGDSGAKEPSWPIRRLTFAPGSDDLADALEQLADVVRSANLSADFVKLIGHVGESSHPEFVIYSGTRSA